MKSDIVTGEYFIYLPPGKQYGYYASKKDYFQASQQIDLTNISGDSTLVQDIRLVSIIETEPDDTTGIVEIDFNFHTIHFDINKFDIKKESTYELNRIVNLVTQYDFFDIEIIGHTDNVGSIVVNDTLSYKRANAVLTYLETNGILKERITIKGLGERDPIATNETEAGRKLNRRVEVKLIRES